MNTVSLMMSSQHYDLISNVSIDTEIPQSLSTSFNFRLRYIDDVLPINNRSFDDHLHTLYPPELEIKETTEISYLDLLLSVTTLCY